MKKNKIWKKNLYKIKNWDELHFLFITADHLYGTYLKSSEKLTFLTPGKEF